MHYAEGRLSTDELEVRVEEIYGTGTQRELATYFSASSLRGIRRLLINRAQRFQRALLRMHLATYLTANASLVGIWALTGQGIFWPAWFLIPSTALLGWHLVASLAFTRAVSSRLAGADASGDPPLLVDRSGARGGLRSKTRPRTCEPSGSRAR